MNRMGFCSLCRIDPPAGCKKQCKNLPQIFTTPPSPLPIHTTTQSAPPQEPFVDRVRSDVGARATLARGYLDLAALLAHRGWRSGDALQSALALLGECAAEWAAMRLGRDEFLRGYIAGRVRGGLCLVLVLRHAIVRENRPAFLAVAGAVRA